MTVNIYFALHTAVNGWFTYYRRIIRLDDFLRKKYLISYFRNIKIQLCSEPQRTKTKESESYVNHLSLHCNSFLLFLSPEPRLKLNFDILKVAYSS